MQFDNGMPADRLTMARWRKSQASNPSGSCVEIAELPGGQVAVRNSRDKSGHYLEVMNRLSAEALTPVGTIRFLKEIIADI